MSTFGDVKVSTINGGPTGAKNAIINGNFGINQRGVSGTVTLSAGAYGHDRWKAGASGCTYTFATSGNVTTITISAGSLVQVIEGINLESGTYTLSWTGTAQGKIGSGSFGNSGITGTATGGTNLNIEFDTGTVSLVQFELGTVATPFERRQYGQELALCERYCLVFGGGSFSSIGVSGYAFSTTGATTYVTPPVDLRGVPSVSTLGNLRLVDGQTAIATTSVAVNANSTEKSLIVDTSVASGLTQYRPYTLTANNDANARVIFSSEL